MEPNNEMPVITTDEKLESLEHKKLKLKQLWKWLLCCIGYLIGIIIIIPNTHILNNMFLIPSIITGPACIILPFLIFQKTQEIKILENKSIDMIESVLGFLTSFSLIIIIPFILYAAYVELSNNLSSESGSGLFFIGFFTSAYSLGMILISISGLTTHKGSKKLLMIGLIGNIISLLLPWIMLGLLAYLVNLNR